MTTRFDKGLRPGLYAITDSLLTPPETLVDKVEAALCGGAVLIQYREKSAPESERLSQARDLQAACHNAGVPLIINDDPHLAQRVGAAGVHLGQGDRSLAEARHLLGDSAIIGITCHDSLALAADADTGGADYLAFGRFFASGTKPGAPPADQRILAQARQFDRPITAIGGVTIDNGAELILGGADLLAVVGGLFGVPEPAVEEQARRFSRLFASHHPLFQTD
ncbi:MAG: thiamine phosphate synthase [Marinobacter sp.]|uniref:thiamine phosphate synthase n=1 Tax=Marinobacter sp. TaxID=50741 RepID=UPI00299D5F69|nr:thiamine phosphate synthase [Marinobacter sp.]MDX1757614.1 thiamine phosphate synthase [Marinobacter sp.]